MKVIFFGTPAFAAKVLKDLFEARIEIAAVISKPDRPKGRSLEPVPTPVKIALQECNPHIPLFQPEVVSAPEFREVLAGFHADLFVVVAYGEIIKQHLLDMPALGCINLHASLLPKYRGAAPIQRSIMNGEVETGVTIMYMVRKMDAGDIIDSVTVPISPNDTYGEIEEKLCQSGSFALIKVIKDLELGKIKRKAQDHLEATYAPKIELEDCQINWNLPAAVIHNLIRGVNPYPGAWCIVDVKGASKRLRINRSIVLQDFKGSPGEILSYGKKGFVVACGDVSLQILDLQLEGKKSISADEFMRGFSKEIITFFH